MKIEQKLVEYVTKTLVDHPDGVRVDRVVDDRGILLTLHVDDEDLGRVIGKGGATAQSLRLILKALGSKNGERYNLRIADGQPRPEAPTADPGPSAVDPADDDDEDAGEAEEAEEADQPPPATKADDSDDEDEADDKPESESAVEKAKSELASLDDLDI